MPIETYTTSSFIQFQGWTDLCKWADEIEYPLETVLMLSQQILKQVERALPAVVTSSNSYLAFLLDVIIYT